MKPESVRILDGVTGIWFSGGDQAKQTAVSPDGHLGGHNLVMHVLLAGDVYDLASGRVEERTK